MYFSSSKTSLMTVYNSTNASSNIEVINNMDSNSSSSQNKNIITKVNKTSINSTSDPTKKV